MTLGAALLFGNDLAGCVAGVSMPSGVLTLGVSGYSLSGSPIVIGARGAERS